MFNNQTEEEEEKEVIFERERERDNKEYWCALRKHLVINQFQLQKLQTKSSCFLVWFAMVQVMLSLWSLFIESLGSYRRCRVFNGVMPCVLGPTSFYLKIWVNILIKRWNSECCCVLDDLHLGSSCMNEHNEFLGVSYAFHMNFWAITKVWAFPHTSESYFPRFA